jgi:hypothetical protein
MAIQASQSGNVLFLILLAVGLFAALSYVVSDGSRGGSGTISSEKARLAANEILSYHASMKATVETLQQRGCSENDFGFSHPIITRTSGEVIYYDSPTMKNSCKLFDPSGGNFTPKTFTEYAIPIIDVLNQYNVLLPGSTRTMIGRFKGTGNDTSPELYFHTNAIKKEVCEAINKQLKIDNGNPLLVTGVPNRPYNGNFASLSDFAVGKAGEEAAIGLSMFCTSIGNVNIAGGVSYNFISVVIPR